MKLNAVWLTTAAATTVTLVAVSSLSRASQQMLTPQVAHAAKVAANLFKDRSMRPILLTRGAHSSLKTAHPFAINVAQSDQFIHYTLNRQLPLGYPTNQLEQVSPRLISSRSSLQKAATLPTTTDADSLDLVLQSAEFQNWVGSLDGTLKQQKYQIKKLEFELAQEQYRNGTVTRAAFNRKAGEYHLASQEFKVFLNSYKMTN